MGNVQSDFEHYDADELLEAILDIPGPPPFLKQVFLEESVCANAVSRTNKESPRHNPLLQNIQVELEKLQFLAMQQTEEIYYLKSKMEGLEARLQKNIKEKKASANERKSERRKTIQDIRKADVSSALIDYTRQVKSRRS